jgi:hypothetical protein
MSSRVLSVEELISCAIGGVSGVRIVLDRVSSAMDAVSRGSLLCVQSRLLFRDEMSFLRS